MKFRISRKRREFGAPVFFSDRNVSDAKDGFVECPSYEDESYGLLKKELDKGIQVGLSMPICNKLPLRRGDFHASYSDGGVSHTWFTYTL